LSDPPARLIGAMKKGSEKVIFSMKGVPVNDEIRGAVKALEATGETCRTQDHRRRSLPTGSGMETRMTPNRHYA
jgi:hypothetical protein